MNREQLEEFVTYGVVSLPSFLSAAQLQHYRDQAHPQLSAQANNGEDLLDGRGGSKALDLTPSLEELPQVNALIAQIGGGRFTPEVSFPLSVRLLGHRVRYSSMHLALIYFSTVWVHCWPQHEREKTKARCKVTLPASAGLVPFPPAGTAGGTATAFENIAGHVDVRALQPCVRAH